MGDSNNKSTRLLLEYYLSSNRVDLLLESPIPHKTFLYPFSHACLLNTVVHNTQYSTPNNIIKKKLRVRSLVPFDFFHNVDGRLLELLDRLKVASAFRIKYSDKFSTMLKLPLY